MPGLVNSKKITALYTFIFMLYGVIGYSQTITAIDISANVTSSFSFHYCDSINIVNRPLPAYDPAIALLNAQLKTVPTDYDTLHVLRAFVHRIIVKGGASTDSITSKYWKGLSFRQQYEYLQKDSDGLYCGDMANTMSKLLAIYGFNNTLITSIDGVHTFPITELRDKKLWLADSYGLEIFIDSATKQELDFVTYLNTIKLAEPGKTVKMKSLPAFFGEPFNFVPPKYNIVFTQCGLLNRYVDSMKYNSFFPKGADIATINQWLPRFLSLAEKGSKYRFKVCVGNTFADWAKTVTAVPPQYRTATHLFAAPVKSSVSPVKCANPVWGPIATQLVQKALTNKQ